MRRLSDLRAPLVGGVLALGALALIRVRDPGVPGSYGLCPWLAITGMPCAGCGGLRAIHALTHGDLGAAWSFNALAVVVLFAGAALWLRWTVLRWRGRPAALPALPLWAVAAGVLAIVGFWILRLTPFGAGLAP